MRKKSAKKEAQWVGVWAKCAKKVCRDFEKKLCKKRLNFFVVIVVSEGVEV